jgi:hypothetical protein
LHAENQVCESSEEISKEMSVILKRILQSSLFYEDVEVVEVVYNKFQWFILVKVEINFWFP